MFRKGWKTWVAVGLAAAMMPFAAFAQESETETELQTEAVYEEAKVMYLTDTVRVRQEANADSETSAFADRGEALTVLGELNGWYHVRMDQPEAESESEAAEADDAAAEPAKEGYVKGSYLTENKDEADQAVAAN